MKYATLFCFGAGLLMSSAVTAAEETGNPIASLPATASTNAPSRSSDNSSVLKSDDNQPLSEDDLNSYRGGETSIVSNQTLNALTSGNVFNGNFVAGSVALSDNALSNFNGVGNFAINTGAQVSLQSAMNLTINVGQ